MPNNIVTLKHPSGAHARIFTTYGFNCFDLQLIRGGKPTDILWAMEGFEEGGKRPSASGIPILFPFPGRIEGATLEWEGKRYPVKEASARGAHAIHGFVHTRRWRVLDQTTSRIVGQFHASLDDASLLERWPADFRITATYELTENTLQSTFVIENPDKRPLPCGLGTHPYFRVPLGGDRAEDCIVRLPVTEQWELVELIPTGRRIPVAGAEDYQSGLHFGGLQLDNVFTNLQFDGEWCSASIEDPDTTRRLTIRWDRAFPHCVVFTPPHREAICIEPYTCAPGAVQLQPRGIDADLWLLKPGETRTARSEIALS